ncbi:MAG: universal stress protein [Ilumatobacteraceae bacterium]
MTKHIIVGVDDSETAAHAARVAADLARKLGGVLHVIMACDDEVVTEVGVGSDQLVINKSDEAAEIASGIADSLRGDGLEVTSAARYGRPHEALIDEAKQYEDSLLVVGNRRMQGAGRVLGSIANSVAHNAPCDVYVVKTT